MCELCDDDRVTVATDRHSAPASVNLAAEASREESYDGRFTLDEARAWRRGYKVMEEADNLRIVPSLYGALLKGGAVYAPRAVALVPRHGDTESEHRRARRIVRALHDSGDLG